jgi:hypothetical protein
VVHEHLDFGSRRVLLLLVLLALFPCLGAVLGFVIFLVGLPILALDPGIGGVIIILGIAAVAAFPSC